MRIPPAISSARIVGAIMKKDLRLYARNRVYLFLTLLGLLSLGVLFWVMPDEVEEAIILAVSPPVKEIVEQGRAGLHELGFSEEKLMELERADFSNEESIELVELESEALLREVIAGTHELYRTGDGDLLVRNRAAGEKRPGDAHRLQIELGIVFPGTFIADVAGGKQSSVKVYADSAVPEEIRAAIEGFVRENGYQLAGRELPVELPEEEAIILGPDRAGTQDSLREKLRPLLAFFTLLIETFAMASLVSTELLQRTVTALQVTPMKIGHFLAAKIIFGTVMAFLQGLLILLLVGAFTPHNWLLLFTIILLGSLLFTSVAMLIGAAGKGFLDQLIYALLFTIPLLIPAFAMLFPGTASSWIRMIPSFPLVGLLMGVTVDLAGWSESLPALAATALWSVLLCGASLAVLKRKVKSL